MAPSPYSSVRAPGAVLALAVALLTAMPTGAQVEAIDVGGLETRSAALMLSGQEAGDLAVSVLAIPMPGPAAESTRVVLVVDVDGGSLLAGAAGELLITELYAYALAAPGEALAATLTQAFLLELDSYRDALARSGVKFLGHLDLVPGEYSLRILVLHRQVGRFALRVVPLTVPSWQGAEPALLPPIFPEAAERWLVVTAAPAGESAEPAFPLVVEGRPVVPSTRPLIAGGDRAELLLMGRGMDAELRAQLVSEDRAESVELSLDDLRPLPPGPAGLELAVATPDLSGQPPGRYQLTVTFAAANAPAVTAPSPLWIVRPAVASGPTLWTEREALTGDAAPGDLVPGTEETSALTRTDPGAVVADAAAAYRQALVQLAAENRSAARAAIIDFETVVVDERAADRDPVAEAQLRAAISLVGENVEGLVPLIWLHEELCRQYHRHQRPRLAVHSRQTLFLLAAAYGERTATPQRRRLAASALVSVAGYLQEIGARPAAQQAFERAVALDPTHEAALLSLAIIHEAYGDHEGTADLLRRLHEVRPDDSEARLRLAINLRRLGRQRQALELLRQCIEDPEVSWVTALAYQELASVQVAEERYREAAATLRAALVRLPANQRLHVQLAAVLDGLEEPAEARAVLDHLDPVVGRDADSPRLRYCRMPTDQLAAAHRELEQAAAARLPAVAASLPPAASAQQPAASAEQ